MFNISNAPFQILYVVVIITDCANFYLFIFLTWFLYAHLCNLYCVYSCKLGHGVLGKWLLMSSEPISMDVHRLHYSLVGACCFCSSILLFSISCWFGEWVGVIYMCPHPPASFRIRVECHFLLLFPRLPSLSESTQTLPAIITQPYSAGCEVGSHLAPQTDTFINKLCHLNPGLPDLLSPAHSDLSCEQFWVH